MVVGLRRSSLGVAASGRAETPAIGVKDGRWSGRRARLNGRTSSHHRGSDQQVVDTEVADLLHQAGRRAVDLLGEHRQTLDHLTELLLERETVDRTDVDEILGSIPGRRQPVG